MHTSIKSLQNSFCIIFLVLAIVGCKNDSSKSENSSKLEDTRQNDQDTLPEFASEPLVTDLYTADPSAHVFEGKIYIYPSHDIDTKVLPDNMGSQYDMKDYHVFSMDSIGEEVTDHGVILDVKNVAWAKKQMWAPDAAEKNGTYYFYFPAKNEEGIFKIGVATSENPEGPFNPQEKPIEGSFSIDPAVFEDSDGEYYMYFGGIWGGQLQRWQNGEYVGEDVYPKDDEPALTPKIAKMSGDMLSFAEEPKDVIILDQEGNPITAGDHDKRIFEAAWVHKYEDKYYLSYSTGDTHKIVYATGDNPYGPYTYQGVVLEPVLGWSNHHSIVEYKGNWYLFYHDTSLSGGQDNLRSIKMTELEYNEDGSIKTIDSMRDED